MPAIWAAGSGVAQNEAKGLFGGFDASDPSSVFDSSEILAVNECCAPHGERADRLNLGKFQRQRP
jgi:hypothetical protein